MKYYKIVFFTPRVEKHGKLNTPRQNLACVTVGDNIYISGGNDYITGGYQEWDTVERYTYFINKGWHLWVKKQAHILIAQQSKGQGI